MLQVCSAGKYHPFMLHSIDCDMSLFTVFPSLAMAFFAFDKRLCLNTLVAQTGHLTLFGYMRNQR